MYLQVAVKVLSGHHTTPAETPNADQEINQEAYAAQACPQVVRVIGHCTKDQQVCLVMLRHEGSQAALVKGELMHTWWYVSSVDY